MLQVVNYHYIRNNFDAKYPSIFGVTPLQFKKQLKLLLNQGDIISPSDFSIHFKEMITSKGNYYLLTFDDGLKEQFDLAFTILRDEDLKAIFFLNSINFEEKKVSTVHKIHLLRSILSPNQFLNFLDEMQAGKLLAEEIEKAHKNYRFDDASSAELKYLLNFKIPLDKQELLLNAIFKQFFNENEIVEKLYMTESQIQTLSDLNCLGSHSHSHFPLGRLSEDTIKFELEHSKKYFEKITNNPISMIAYPYGTDESCSDLVAELAKKAKYSFGFTTKKGTITMSQNQLLLNRFDCNDVIGGKNFKQ